MPDLAASTGAGDFSDIIHAWRIFLDRRLPPFAPGLKGYNRHGVTCLTLVGSP